MSSETTVYCSPSFALGTGKVLYTRAQIDAAVSQALALLLRGQQIGEGHFPQVLKKNPSPLSKAEAPVFVFPLLADDKIYVGSGSPGPDRVLFGSVARDFASADYAGVAAEDIDAEAAAAADGCSLRFFGDTSVHRELAGAHAFDKAGAVTDPVAPPTEGGRELLVASDVPVPFAK